jgi:hypothetical protein
MSTIKRLVRSGVLAEVRVTPAAPRIRIADLERLTGQRDAA